MGTEYPGQGEFRFRDWFACPECNERDAISPLANGTEIVLECYACGLISEYVVGKDVSLQNLDIDAIEQVADGLGDTSP